MDYLPLVISTAITTGSVVVGVWRLHVSVIDRINDLQKHMSKEHGELATKVSVLDTKLDERTG